MTLRTLVARYATFAVVAIIANLATQRAVLHFDEGPVYFMFAVGAGTLVGLVVKYVLDKRWIFYDRNTSIKHHSRTFSLYTAMGLITTAIFWGTETAFWLIWQTHLMREVGAVLGLGVGYIVKYYLDRRFVFTNRQMGQIA